MKEVKTSVFPFVDEDTGEIREIAIKHKIGLDKVVLGNMTATINQKCFRGVLFNKTASGMTIRMSDGGTCIEVRGIYCTYMNLQRIVRNQYEVKRMDISAGSWKEEGNINNMSVDVANFVIKKAGQELERIGITVDFSKSKIKMLEVNANFVVKREYGMEVLYNFWELIRGNYKSSKYKEIVIFEKTEKKAALKNNKVQTGSYSCGKGRNLKIYNKSSERGMRQVEDEIVRIEFSYEFYDKNTKPKGLKSDNWADLNNECMETVYLENVVKWFDEFLYVMSNGSDGKLDRQRKIETQKLVDSINKFDKIDAKVASFFITKQGNEERLVTFFSLVDLEDACEKIFLKTNTNTSNRARFRKRFFENCEQIKYLCGVPNDYQEFWIHQIRELAENYGYSLPEKKKKNNNSSYFDKK